jgi:MscS family membrane protein
MNEILNQVYGNNSLKDYLFTFIILLLAVLLSNWISKLVAFILFKLVRRIWNNVDSIKFIQLVKPPLAFFLIVFIGLVALHRLNFPPDLEFQFYRYEFKEFIQSVGTFILVIAFIWLVLRIVDFIAFLLKLKANEEHLLAESQVIIFFKDFFKVIIVIIGFLLTLKFVFGYNIGSFLTGLSIVGAALALSLRESIENLVASFIIFFDKPFTVGDYLSVQNITGTVEKIGLRSTRIRTDQKSYVTVPNKQMVDSILDNHSMRTHRRVILILDISLSVSSDKINQFVEGVNTILKRSDIQEPLVHISDITKFSYQVKIDYHTEPVMLPEINSIKQSVNLEIIQLMEKMGIAITGSSADLRITEQ